MTVLQVQGVAGGVGASTLAWCLAEAASAWLFDCSTHQGGLLHPAGMPESRFGSTAWPAVVDADGSAEAVLQHAARWYGVNLLSGASPPSDALLQRVVEAAVQAGGCAVLDGPESRQLPRTLLCAVGTNQPRVWERLRDCDAELIVIRMTRDGLSSAEVRSGLTRGRLWLVPDESAVRKGVDLGWGVPPRARLRRACAELWQSYLRSDE